MLPCFDLDCMQRMSGIGYVVVTVAVDDISIIYSCYYYYYYYYYYHFRLSIATVEEELEMFSAFSCGVERRRRDFRGNMYSFASCRLCISYMLSYLHNTCYF